MNFIGIIPARFASTRFPGKPLIDIKGKTMIERVYLQASKILTYVYVATDDQRIADDVKRFGGKVIMTLPTHQSGTDRCAEALQLIETSLKIKFDVVINIQGDEPFIQPSQLQTLMDCFQSPQTDIASLVKPLHENADIFNPNFVKVTMDKNNRALYFSRSPIPYVRGKEQREWINSKNYYKHLGIYAYRTSVLKEITQLSQSSLELAESLEQLRWLENGYCIRLEKTDFESIAVDTPEDLKKIEALEIED